MNLQFKLRKLGNTPLGLRLRTLLDYRRPSYYFHYQEPVSDAFFWRVDEVWDTRFDLCHTAGILKPGYDEPYDVLLAVFDAEGNEIARRTECVEPMKIKRLALRELAGDHSGLGTFSVFHLFDKKSVLVNTETCVAERGYTSYRRKTDAPGFWSYAHGNVYIRGYDPATGRVQALGQPTHEPWRMRPQVTFEDCRHFELCFANPVNGPFDMTLNLLGSGNQVLETRQQTLQPFSGFVFSSEGLDVVSVEVLAKFTMFRPIIFKYYDSHFDVFHA